ncbi:Ketosteroid isomerase homolog [Flagellimonas taeanensis]|jgi:ketosteroid isomerase-like protein|uniref:Ketosteroid isomerase homolog n=1 Tax=Flagellimonas taeanensis TaxID=1005926 RepID=A0A1M6QP07_9FLAO|nr:nuclear transport factor 2 family protein [Allomuricauda taeanensis]SFB71839.1 Ketosteroid isomerase homolog [Allomuricauda taeanensis]SHK21905.1 Ketosteroid isomerase homolog [Allomuricauda taeanensis]
MKKVLFLLFVLPLFGIAQTTTEQEDRAAIAQVLSTQQTAWNNFDIESFMETYWKSDALTFYGSAGVVKGWQKTLERYKKSYPTQEHFGHLEFVTNDISKITDDAYTVMGEYHLTRPVGDTRGIFMLVLKRIDGEWKIIADTSCKVE